MESIKQFLVFTKPNHQENKVFLQDFKDESKPFALSAWDFS